MNNKKILLLFLIIPLLASCFSNNIQQQQKNPKKPTRISTLVVTKSGNNKELFVKNYPKEDIPIYEEIKTLSLHEEITAGKKDLLSLTKSDSLNVIGSPNLIKNEDAIEIWQYRFDSCIVSFFWDNKHKNLTKIYGYNSKFEKINYKKCLIDAIIKNKTILSTPNNTIKEEVTPAVPPL